MCVVGNCNTNMYPKDCVTQLSRDTFLLRYEGRQPPALTSSALLASALLAVD